MQCCDKYQLLGSFIDEHKEEKGILISVLHKAQELFGELNEDVQTFVADNLGIPLIEVYGVSTFYAQFTLEKKGKYIVGVCMGTTCYVLKPRKLLTKLRKNLA